MVIRKRIYEIIDKSDKDDFWSRVYSFSMIFFILISIIPLAFKEDCVVFRWMDGISTVAFILDYFLRFITADYLFKKQTLSSFIRYPFSFMGIIDLLSILPSLSVLNEGFKTLRLVRMIKALKVIRIFKAMRYSKSFLIIVSVLKNSKQSLIAVCVLAAGYIIVSALIIFNVEPDSFHTFFDAIYWATVSLTTVGYGDIYPVSAIGRLVAMFSSLFGIAIVALPASIITAGYMSKLNEQKEQPVRVTTDIEEE